MYRLGSGSLLYLSGQLPFENGQLVCKGSLGDAVSLEEGYRAARQVAINALAIIKGEVGSLDRVERVVKVVGFVASTPDFHDQPKVINGASDLLLDLFGDRGCHARSAVGTNALPLGSPVEVEMIVEIG